MKCFNSCLPILFFCVGNGEKKNICFGLIFISSNSGNGNEVPGTLSAKCLHTWVHVDVDLPLFSKVTYSCIGLDLVV